MKITQLSCRSSKAGVNSVTSTAEREQIKMELKKIDHLIAIKASEDETMTREVQAKPVRNWREVSMALRGLKNEINLKY